MKRVLTCIIVLIVLVGGYFLYKSSSGKATNSAGSTSQGAQAQSGRMGGFPGGAGRFEAMQKEHKYAFQLMKLVNNIGRLEESGKEPLTRDQAKSILAVIQPLQKKETLDETSAKDAIKLLQSILTDKQRLAINALPDEKQFRQGGPPPGTSAGKRPFGPPRAGGPDSMKSFNPLNRPAGGPPGMQGPQGQKRRGVETLLEDLKKKSGS